MSVLKSRSEDPKEKSNGFLARYGVKPDSPVPDMKRRIDHHHPHTQPLLSTPLFSHLPALSTAAAQLSYCHDLPAHPTQHQQHQHQRSSTAVRDLRGLFAKHPSWAPGVLDAQRSGAVAPSGCVPYTGCTAVLPGLKRTIISRNLCSK